MQVQVVIPMAGLGTRFANSGYSVPKPLLPIHGEPMFKVVMANLMDKRVASFTVIAQAEWDLGGEIAILAQSIRQTINLIEIDYITDGPASTVELARPFLRPEWPVVTGNSDQYVASDMEDFYHQLLDGFIDGSILTMEDDDPKWSYAAVSPEGLVSEVREKKVISPYATVGIYGFRTADLMYGAFERMKQQNDSVNNEFYVAPAYNHLIQSGLKISSKNLGPISQVMYGLGIPSDYESFIRKPVSKTAALRAREMSS